MHFAQARKSSTPSCRLVCSLLHTLIPSFELPAGACAVGGRVAVYLFRQPLLRFASPTGRLLSSLLFFLLFPVSPLTRTPAQLLCYESKGRLGYSKCANSNCPRHRGHPSSPPKYIPKLSSNSRGQPRRRWKRPRSVSDRSCRSHARNLKLSKSIWRRETCPRLGFVFFFFLFF